MRNNWLICSIAGMLLLSSCQTSAPVASTSPYFEQGNQYAKDGLLREALQAYKKELAQHPDNTAAHRNIGIVYVKAGDYKRAEYHLERSLPNFEDNYEANYYLAEAYRAREKFGEAIFRYKRALESKSNDVKSLKALAWSYYKIRFYSEALRTSLALRKAAPKDIQVPIIIARTLIKLERPDKALGVIRKAEASATQSSMPYLKSVAGDIYRKMDNCEKALAQYRAALKDQPLLAGALLGLGQCLLQSGQETHMAITYMERALRIKPRLAEGLYLLGKAYEKTDRAKSLKYYKQFRKQAGSDPEYLSFLPEIRERIEEMSKPAAAAPKAASSQPSGN